MRFVRVKDYKGDLYILNIEAISIIELIKSDDPGEDMLYANVYCGTKYSTLDLPSYDKVIIEMKHYGLG